MSRSLVQPLVAAAAGVPQLAGRHRQPLPGRMEFVIAGLALIEIICMVALVVIG